MRSRTPLLPALLLPLVLPLLISGCSGGDGVAEPAAPSTSSAPSAPAPTEPSPTQDAPEAPRVPDEDPPPCEAVRDGIDAFNDGDPETTVRLFRGAVPDAEAYAEDEPSRTADLLLAAIRYYADLPAEEYAAAITGSPDFRRHQVVTLAVCRYGQDQGSGPTDDAVPA